MPTIPAGTKFHGVASTVDTKDRGSNNANNRREAYTIEDISSSTGGTLQVSTLTLQGTTSSTTSQAIYGINIIDTATTSNLATRLPDPTTGRQTTFVNNSTMSILVFPSVAGGKINGVVDGYASIPNDGKSYTFFCIQNPLPGAWTWSPPAVGQLQVPRISISHTNGAETIAYGVGRTAPFTGLAQIVNPQCPDPNTGIIGPCAFPDVDTPGGGSYFMAVSQIHGGPIGFAGQGGEYLWFSEPNLTPKRTITATKVYSNFLASDSPSGQAPSIQRYMAQAFAAPFDGLPFFGNYWASKVYLESNPPAPYIAGSGVIQGSLNSPVEVGDQGTLFTIQPANTVAKSTLLYANDPTGITYPTDWIGTGDMLLGSPPIPSPNFHSFGITIPADSATKTYEFDIFLEHT